MKLTEILEDIILTMKEEAKKSPLSGREEAIAKKLKPALQKMKDQYGDTKGKEYFYGHIRNLAKKKK